MYIPPHPPVSSTWRVGLKSIAELFLHFSPQKLLENVFRKNFPQKSKTTTGFTKYEIVNRKTVAGSAGGCNFGDLQSLSLFSGLHPNSFCRHTTFLGLIELIRIYKITPKTWRIKWWICGASACLRDLLGFSLPGWHHYWGVGKAGMNVDNLCLAPIQPRGNREGVQLKTQGFPPHRRRLSL